MVSFGIVEEADWSFYAIFPVFFLGFVLIPGGLGAIGAIARGDVPAPPAEDGLGLSRRAS